MIVRRRTFQVYRRWSWQRLDPRFWRGLLQALAVMLAFVLLGLAYRQTLVDHCDARGAYGMER